MRKLQLILLAAIVLAVAPATMASIVIDQGPWSYGNGGEFTVLPTTGDPLNGVLGFYDSTVKGQHTNNSGSGGFQTFCIEENEYFTPGQTYTYSLSDMAKFNAFDTSHGYDPLKGGDPLSIGTAWLYNEFTKGTSGALAAIYDFNNTSGLRNADAGQFQIALWALENEVAAPTNNIYLNLVTTTLHTNVYADANGAYGIKAINVFQNGVACQDQLVKTPIPSAVWLLGSGLVGLIGIRRKYFG